MRWWLIGGLLWAQPYLDGEGGGILAHRVPIVRGQPWQGLAHQGGDRRVPGPGGWLGLAAGYTRTPIHSFRLGIELQHFGLQVADRSERFWYVVAPLTTVWRLRVGERPWYLGLRLSAAILVSAMSRPDVATVYRFRDYFSRSTLRGGIGLEKSIRPRLKLLAYADIDLLSTWDKGLFRNYNALAHHVFLGMGLSYRLWH